ncbi:GntR family transcriptional regulator [Bacillus suaedae]|uniref:GntR family transcriptional regulator n=1 Tax=Halalkalibacter suaedae TaxID=2822140 RepID=A0A940WP01_9BACI|nr:GntR family transcriptional regulator [Bacillus suaedae]MBP3949969.1 GntR family transcriptional regulator [Bacillus suaedae]
MILDHDGNKPIYVQISDWLESEILRGNLHVDEKVYSQYQLADMFTINPATAAKGLNLLVDDDILFKKRGLGMFVSEHAKEIILQKRKNGVLQQLVADLVKEARQLNVDETELLEMIKEANQKEGEEG